MPPECTQLACLHCAHRVHCTVSVIKVQSNQTGWRYFRKLIGWAFGVCLSYVKRSFAGLDWFLGQVGPQCWKAHLPIYAQLVLMTKLESKHNETWATHDNSLVMRRSFQATLSGACPHLARTLTHAWPQHKVLLYYDEWMKRSSSNSNNEKS